MTPQKKLNTCESKWNNITSWEQGNGTVVRALTSNQLRHGFKSRRECHMWVEFVVELLYFAPSGFCLATPVFASPQKTKSEFDWTYCYKSLLPWVLDHVNTTYVGIFYFKQIYRHWNAKTNDFWSLFHSFLFWNIVNRTLPYIPKFQFDLEW